MKLFNIFPIIIILILIYIYYNYINTKFDTKLHNEFNNEYNYKLNNELNNSLSYLDGYWISNIQFNKESDIDNMILYIDFNNKTGKLMIISDNNILSQDDIILNINNKTIKKSKNILNKFYFTCKFKKLKSSKDNLFIWKNLEFKCSLSINNGNLKLFCNNTLYADLNKDNIISNYINDLE
jgi:hypothetical protein